MPDHIRVPRSQFQALLREARHGASICDQLTHLRIALRAAQRHVPNIDREAQQILRKSVELCADAARLRIEFETLARRLRELDPEMTPVRPSSRQDIKAAFDASVDFAQGKRKPDDKPDSDPEL